MPSRSADDVRSAATRAGDNRWMERAARAGYVTNGVVHALIAFIALRLAWGNSSGDRADQSGALEQLGRHPLGAVVLWACVVGFAALAVVLVTSTLAPGVEWTERAKALGKAVLYAGLALLAWRFATGGGGQSDSRETSVDVTRSLMELPFGALIVGAVGLAVVGIGGYHIYKGATRRFLDDLEGSPGPFGTWSGELGYIAKGIALILVGGLFCWAAVTSDPSQATGLDGGLRTLLEQPMGPWLLTLVALGLAAFGVYSVFRARSAKL